MKRSLVLGGGGVVGVSWLVGMLQGLAEGGVDLFGEHAADEVIGTSAGSIVGALLARGDSASQMRANALDDTTSSIVGEATASMDFALLIECFDAWAKLPDITPESLAAIGAYGLKAPTIAEERWVGSMRETVGDLWPVSRYRCTAVDASSGDFVLWGSESEVALATAVASSCTVPAIFPPVTINGRRYVDGGVRSGTSADFADGDIVVVIAPIGSFEGDPMDAGAARLLADEVAILEARGATVVWTFTDDETNAATLTTPLGRMDPDMRQPAIDQGARQGRAFADKVVAAGW